MTSFQPFVLCAALLSAVGIPVLASADDTEVFFASSFETNAATANVLFMFDNSGSMDKLDGTPFQRITRLKQAMLEILEAGDGVNIGLGAFNGGDRGGAILYPSVDPNSDTCPNATCEEIVLRVPVKDETDDAVQLENGDVELHDEELRLTRDSSNGSATPGNTIGIRFADVGIPRGATITYAALEFVQANKDDKVSNFIIRGEDIGHAETFSASTNNISNRLQTLAIANWSAGDWEEEGVTESTSDISAVVQEITNRGDWCSGNAMAFTIEGPGFRRAYSRDTNAWKVPTLKVGYDPRTVDFATTCTSGSTTARVTNAGDDGTQDLATSANDLSEAVLEVSGLGAGKMIGLRFDDVDIEQNASISSAYLVMSSQGSDDALRVELEAGSGASAAAPFDGADADIGSRALAASMLWDLPDAIAGERVSSIDISDLITSTISAASWTDGDPLIITLRPDAGSGARRFRAAEAGGSLAPKLLINYRVEGSDTNGTPRLLRTAREDMVDIVRSFRADGGTPLVDSYYESAAYMLGEDVDYGLQRFDGSSRESRYYRTSTPLSWTGGQLSTPPGCNEVDANAVACIGQSVPSTAVYDAPVTGSCQANQIVLLSDGAVTKGSPQTRIGNLISPASCTSRLDCGVKLAGWLLAGDESVGRKPILTHTVGFNFTSNFLRDVAVAGGGSFQEAKTATELAGVFKNIVDSAAQIDTSFVAPAATVSQFNRMANRNDVYFAMFRPSLTTRWDGNLKRYEINKPPGEDDAILLDALVQPAIDPVTGDFAASARSFWTDGAADGPDVALGGAANELTLPRNLLTYAGEPTGTAPLTVFGVNNADIDVEALGIDGLGLPDAAAEGAYRSALLSWASGVDVLDVDEDGNETEVRHQIGDPMHSSPIVMNYADEGSGALSLVFVGTNEGFVHAIDSEDGGEHYGFIPPELYGNLHRFFEDALVQRGGGAHDRPYGLDGEMSGWHDDTNRDGVIDSGERAFLYFGMRRGGRNYYALDVSDRDSPSLAWVIRGGSGDFTELGQSWSTPHYTKMRDGTAVRDVLVFGAGYDTAGDTRTVREATETDSVGRGLYVVDAATGERLVHVGPTFHNDMDYSIPSTVSIVDIDLDGLADMFWVGDTGARVWRFDIETGGDDAIDARVSGSVAADLGTIGATAARRFYYPPDVTLVQDKDGSVFMNVGIGSGWRAHPLDTIVQDRFYMLRTDQYLDVPRDTDGIIDYPAAVTEAALFDATTTSAISVTPGDIENGWYINMSGLGEKVLGAAVTIDGQVLFTSYLPGEGSEESCNVSVGGGRIYALDAITAEAVIDLDGSLAGATDTDGLLTLDDRFRRLRSPGIPAPISVLLPESSNPAGSAQLSLDIRSKGETLDLESLPSVTRTYWAEQAD